jgi:phosphatidylethanolamine/phosphatidyl-N-methylethanolamine N-methyltransferase
MNRAAQLNDVTDLDQDQVERAYDRWAPIYDLVFGAVFKKGRSAAIASVNRMGGRVLEVGVGTGISLPEYAPRMRVFGIDISAAMLKEAQKRVDKLGLKNVEGLEVMDAANLNFPDGSFDVVMAQYVLSAVSNPEAVLDEFARVLRPGGEIILLSRVSAEAGIRYFIEQGVAPLAHRLGWRTDFAWAVFANWAKRPHGMQLVERRPIAPFGHFSLIRFRKIETATAPNTAPASSVR